VLHRGLVKWDPASLAGTYHVHSTIPHMVAKTHGLGVLSKGAIPAVSTYKMMKIPNSAGGGSNGQQINFFR
jgi:hypothetical protein